MIDLDLAIPTYRKFDLCAQAVVAARAATPPPARVLVVDNSGGQCPSIPGAEIVMGATPQSVASAWNIAMRVSRAPWVVLMNDDALPPPDVFGALLAAAVADPTAGIVSPVEGQRFMLFLLRRAAWENVGPFDEGFIPAYFEDNDYHRRLTLAGWGSPVVPMHVEHAESATVRSFTPAEQRRHHGRFAANMARYRAKWGGLPGRETLDRPWGSA